MCIIYWRLMKKFRLISLWFFTSTKILSKLTSQLTNSVEKSPSWEANRSSSSQDIPHNLWSPKLFTAFTSARHLSISWARLNQSMLPHPMSWRSTLILPSYLHLCLPSGLFPSNLPTKTVYTPLLSLYVQHAQPILLNKRTTQKKWVAVWLIW